MANSIQESVLKRIAALEKGQLIFPIDFRDLGNSNAVKTTLYRFYKEGILDRVSQGIYMVPTIDPVLGKLTPSLEEIAQGIARRDRARIVPAGAYAFNKLGLSTQVPNKLVFLTDGAARLVAIGNRTIKFKTTTPKKLEAKGPISSLVIQAMTELGKKGLTPVIEQRLQEVLKKEDPQNVRHDAALAPVWIGEKMISLTGLNGNT